MNTIATIEEAKAEAIARMKLIGLKQEYIDAFSKEEGTEIYVFWTKWVDNMLPEFIGEAEEEAIIEFENNHSALAWAVIHELVFKEGQDWDGYDLLYVSIDKSKWEEERKALLEMHPTVYYKCVSSESNTVNNGFEEYKIAVSDGIIIGME